MIDTTQANEIEQQQLHVMLNENCTIKEFSGMFELLIKKENDSQSLFSKGSSPVQIGKLCFQGVDDVE
jgi:hypothetical protein